MLATPPETRPRVPDRLRPVLAPTVACILLACSDGSGESNGEPALPDGPLWPTPSWTVQSPDQQGMDARVLEGARDYAFEEGKNTQGVVVVRGGAIVAEWYAEGADENSWAASWSVAKSFTSALIGIAIDEGLIPSVDVSMAEYVPAWKGTEREAITLEHALHMAPGLQWNESYDPNDLASSDVIGLVLDGEDSLEFATGYPLADPPGTVFNYSSGTTMLLSGVIEVATGMSVEDYARTKLVGPVGIEPFQWWADTAGHTLTYCCIDTTSRQLAKFGLLYEREGLWDGEQIVSRDWVAASVTPSPADESYGYQWWLTGRWESRLPPDTFTAEGVDGQFVYVIPSLDLVVVRNGTYDKYDGEPIAQPNLASRVPNDGLVDGLGTLAPDSWSDFDFLKPILDSIREAD